MPFKPINFSFVLYAQRFHFSIEVQKKRCPIMIMGRLTEQNYSFPNFFHCENPLMSIFIILDQSVSCFHKNLGAKQNVKNI